MSYLLVNRPNWQLHALGASHANSVTTNFKLHWHELGGQSWYDQNLALASSSLDLYRQVMPAQSLSLQSNCKDYYYLPSILAMNFPT